MAERQAGKLDYGRSGASMIPGMWFSIIIDLAAWQEEKLGEEVAAAALEA
jgi:hypothetical protein